MKKRHVEQRVPETSATREALSKCFSNSPVSKIMALSFAGLLFSLLTFSSVSARFSGPLIPAEDSVLEAEQPCFASGCHAEAGGTFNTDGAVTLTGLPDRFTPGNTYDLQLSVEGGPGDLFGVQIVSIHEDNSQAGTLTAVTSGLATANYSGVTALTHSSPLDSGIVDFQWTAPAEAAGPVTFRFAMNSANGNGFPTGDSIYFDTETVQPEAAIDLEIVDRLYVPFFGNGTSGNIQFQTSLSLTNTTTDATLVLEFFDRDGQAMMVDMGMGASAMSEIPLTSGQGVTLQTTGAGELQVGYVVIHVAREAGSEDTGGIGGTAVFSRSEADTGIVLYEAGVPLSRTLSDMTVLLDSIDSKDTGLALVNPPGTEADPGGPATLTITVWDSSFQNMVTAPTEVVLAEGEAIGQFIWEIFRDAGATQEVQDQLREVEAVVTVSSDRELSAVTLRQNDDGSIDFPMEVPTLTTFPVIPGRADADQ